MAGKRFRVAADIGGTFTDIVVQDIARGQCFAYKTLSTPENPARAVIRGIEAALPKGADLEFFVHGTTVGLNALLTRNGAKTALLTTDKFRDIYAIQGNDRGEIFSIRWNKPEPLVPLEHTYTVRERISAKGEIVEPLNYSDLDAIAEAARNEGFEALAICLLFAFRNPIHELQIEEYLARRLPGVAIALSHRVSPEWREFERTSTTVMDSYLAPVVRSYLELLVAELEQRLPKKRELYVMESNGGVMSSASAITSPLQTLLSGPVGGAIGGKALSASTGRPNLICIDMGGTSFDASLIIDGRPSSSNETKIEGLPVQMSVVDIHVIGAGGGSIAWEEADALRVGPQSAGSVPGPICYAKGGVDPTVSDANIVLNRLDSANFPENEISLDPESAERALGAMGAKFGLAAHEMAQGIVDIINAKMADSIRTITVRRGIDPRDFSLVAFGGAGPSQAAALAEELEIDEVLIPVHPGAFSAWGMLQTDLRRDFKETLYGFWDLIEADLVEDRFAGLENQGRAYLAAEGMDETDISIERSADFRYHGQEYVLTIPIRPGPLDKDLVQSDFDRAYDRQYGHSSPGARIEMANIRVSAIGRLSKPEIAAPSEAEAGPRRNRKVYFSGMLRETAVLDRADINYDAIVDGPAIIEEGTATTLLPPGWTARLVDGGHLSLKREEKE
ncbi:MAG: hydantoinase/oxoprolinase family protein [Albidovulum sp.]|nr:hydantoinase/oxoprolinase family protein [Albidovulum sp.]